MVTEQLEAVRAALYANLRIVPVPHRMYDWHIEAESIDEAARAVLDALAETPAPLSHTGSDRG